MTIFGNGRGSGGREPRRKRDRKDDSRDARSDRAMAREVPQRPKRVSDRVSSREVPPRAPRSASRLSSEGGRSTSVPSRAPASSDRASSRADPSRTSDPSDYSGWREAPPRRFFSSERPGSKASPRKGATSSAGRPKSKPTRAQVARRAARDQRSRRSPELSSSRRPARAAAEGAPTDKRRRASAGRILGVGLLCFLIWLLVDSNQLYHSAQTGQIGIRRTVAVSILRPIAAVANALGISGPVNAADSALGRCGIGGAPACGGDSGSNTTPPTIPTTTTTTVPRPVIVVGHRSNGYMGFWAAPHLGAPDWMFTPAWPPDIPNPTAKRPLTLLSIGDSIGEDLGFGVGDVFSTDPAVTVVQRGLEDTGLARTDYYNWPSTLESDLRRYHPEIVVVMMGANDAQALYDRGNFFSLGTPTWWRIYKARVALIMEEATRAGAHVMWVGLPPMGPGSTVPPSFPGQVNRVFSAEALAHQGVLYFNSAKVLSKKGRFTYNLTIGGSIEQVRSNDGVHLLPPGYDLLAKDLVQPIERGWSVNLGLGR